MAFRSFSEVSDAQVQDVLESTVGTQGFSKRTTYIQCKTCHRGNSCLTLHAPMQQQCRGGMALTWARVQARLFGFGNKVSTVGTLPDSYQAPIRTLIEITDF